LASLKHCCFADQVPPGRYVWMEVRDTGTGMDEETIKRVFEPFFTTKFTGRGLGLAAVAGIVRAHRGAIQIASEPGKGTHFRVYFPVDAGTCRTITPASTPAPERGQGQGTVLIVDDEPSVR